MTNPKYKQNGFPLRLSKVIEEMGEALAAAGKTQRWGPFSYNPEIPEEERERNIDWLMRELVDVENAISDVRESLWDLENPKNNVVQHVQV